MPNYREYQRPVEETSEEGAK
ncbi:uncharacterized, partial [Tachysurus ichikawai]